MKNPDGSLSFFYCLSPLVKSGTLRVPVIKLCSIIPLGYASSTVTLPVHPGCDVDHRSVRRVKNEESSTVTVQVCKSMVVIISSNLLWKISGLKF